MRLIIVSFDDFLSSEWGIFVVRINDGRTDGWTNGRTRPLIEMSSRL